VSPKDDALRLIHNSMNLLKSIHGIHEHGSRDTLDILLNQDPESHKLYTDLQSALSFFEMFFYVYQLLVAVDDHFDPSDPVILENLDRVAEVMGFGSLGSLRPATRILTHYYEELDHLGYLGNQVIAKVDKHLRKITIFLDLMQNKFPAGFDVNWTDSLIRNLFLAFKQFRRARYWDDILQLMAEDQGRQTIQLIKSIEDLPSQRRLYVFRKLIDIVTFDMESVITLSILIKQHVYYKTSLDYPQELLIWLLEILGRDHAPLKELMRLLYSKPSILTKFLISLDTAHLLSLRTNIDKLDLDGDLKCEKLRNKFNTLCCVLAFSSNNYLRFFSRLVSDRPEIVTYVDNMAYLDRLGQLIWAELSDGKDPADLKARLTTYYQFGFCKYGLEVFNRPENLRTFYKKYHSFFRRYFRWLYRAAQWSVEMGHNLPQEFISQDEDDQPIAVFCTGGYAREEAFENDIDLFIICRDEDPGFLKYASMIVNEINRELNKQGVSTHHHLAELFNSYVIPLSKLEERFLRAKSDDFIEWAQLMGARLLVGSQSFDRALKDLLERRLFNDPDRFIQCLLTEINDRRENFARLKNKSVNVKENPGGLRDIQAIILACQAFIADQEADIWKSLNSLKEKLPDLKSEFKNLERVYKFLRTFKDIYYLCLSPEDDMVRDRLIQVSIRMGIDTGNDSSSEGTAPRLINSYRGHRYRARQSIEIISEYLMTSIEKRRVI